MPLHKLVNTGTFDNSISKLTPKGNLYLSILKGEQPQVRVYQAWPPRAWKLTPHGWRGCRFDLNIQYIELGAKKKRSKKWLEKLENARIFRAGYSPTADAVILKKNSKNHGFFSWAAIEKDYDLKKNSKNYGFFSWTAIEKDYDLQSYLKIPHYLITGPDPQNTWLDQIPKRVRKAMALLGYGDQGILLQACYKVPEFLDLLESSPSLALLALTEMAKNDLEEKRKKAPVRALNDYSPAINWSQRAPLPSSWRYLRRMSRLKRKALAKQLSTSLKAIKVLNKRPRGEMQGIQTKVSTAKCVSHLPKPSNTLLTLLDHHLSQETELMVSQKFLEEIGARTRSKTKAGSIRRADAYVIDTIRDIHWIARDILQAGEKLPTHSKVTNEKSLKEMHETLIETQLRVKKKEDLIPFTTTPPIPGMTMGDTSITPLMSPAALDREGRKMHHCVGSYSNSVKRGRSFIYHVQSEDEVATMEISTHDKGNKRVSQIMGYCNKQPSEELIEAAHTWCEKHDVNTNPGRNWY